MPTVVGFVGRQRLALVTLAGLLASAVLALWTPTDDPSQSICVWRRTTGVPCPGCGMVRACAALMKADVGTAVAYHPLVLLVVGQILVAWAWWMLALSGRVRGARPGTTTLWVSANIVALIGVWIARALTGTLPP